jgi:hypothetical protein
MARSNLSLCLACSLGRLAESGGSRGTLAAWFSHTFARASLDPGTLGCDIGIESWFHRQFHLLSDALARVAGPLALRTTPLIRAQNDFFLPSSFLVFGFGAGAFRLLPVARLYLARPLAVRPAPLLTGNFSPLPIARLTPFLAISNSTQ